MDAQTLERVTLTGRPATVHLVHHHLVHMPDAVVTWCGRYSIPRAVVPGSWRTCRACENAAREEPNGEDS